MSSIIIRTLISNNDDVKYRDDTNNNYDVGNNDNVNNNDLVDRNRNLQTSKAPIESQV